MRRTSWLLAALLALLLAGCGERGVVGGTLILEGPHTYTRGQLLQGDVVLLNGQLFLDEGAQIDGSLHVLEGSARVDGTISGDVTVLGGVLSLGPDAIVRGDLSVGGGGRANRAAGSTVLGEVSTGLALPEVREPASQGIGGWLLDVLLQAAVLVPLALLAAHFTPRPLDRVRRAVARYALVSGALGALAFVVLLSLFVLMAFTIILIPVSVLGLFVMFVAVVYGEIAFALVAAEWLAARMGWARRRPAAIALGTLLFVLLLNLLNLLPVIGAPVVLLSFAVGLGAVLLTRFGFSEYTPPPEMVEAG